LPASALAFGGARRCAMSAGDGGRSLPRIRFKISVLALVLSGLVCASEAAAQSTTLQATPVPFDPLAPPDSKQTKPPAYQKFDPNAPRTAAKETTTFQPPPPAAGAGRTGFDSSNSRRAARAVKSKAKDVAADRKIAPGTPAPVPSSSPRASANDSPTKSFASGPLGKPPVQIGSTPQTPLRKKKKKDIVDPYEPIGFRSGGMLYYPAIELIGGYDSNPQHTPNGGAAGLFTVAPELKLRSDWSSHELKADLRGTYNWYSPDTVPSLNRPYFNGNADGRIDVTRDTRIDLNGKVLVSTDNPNSPNLQAGLATLPIFANFGGSAGLGQKFNRLDVSLKGGIERTVYQNSELTDGSTASNEDRNFNQYSVTLRGGYEMTPGVTPFVEVSGDQRVHDLQTDFFGFQRDSKGLTAKVGTTFELSRMLTGEIAVGWTKRDYEDPRLETLSGLIGNASLKWTATGLTNVRLLATSNVGESNVVGVSGILYRDVALEVEHAFRRWLIGTVKVGYGIDDYVGSDRVDNRYYLSATATYKIDRNWQLKGEARREWLDSDVVGASYAANIFLFGVRWQY
jgi:hypothetical protein